MLATILLFCAISFDESPVLLRQIELDRNGFSCNTIDGVAGGKTDRAIQLAQGKTLKTHNNPFRVATVTQADIDALVPIPKAPAEKAKLPRMGYETIKEMFAERGHMSQRGLERLNPGVDWEHLAVGTKLIIPDFPSIEEELAAGDRGNPRAPKRPLAACVKISLSRLEITAYDANGKLLALFPCSIARDKAKLPPQGELKITSYIPNPNYTYSPDFVPAGKKAARYVFPEGPNCPVGVAWMGLNLPGYGIHGTPRPESIGNAESHGCFRLANWNAARLFAMCRSGTRVIVEQ
ncbi:MAG: L,D-transpeptidase [Kiritimatiellae bacterium]|nr:L,D-transpeptidase [Kiritimatiellia bacterium]